MASEIPGHLMAEIFLRLPTPEDLARVSAACVTFRRLVSDVSFLCRFRRLHTPPLLGFLDLHGFHPALPPHPSAPAARAFAPAADFTFSFLPSHCRWIVQDIRDGRVLLGRHYGEDERPPLSGDLVVCDPLHQQYVLLPSIPDALGDSVEPFLMPLGEDEAAPPFKVICVGHCGTRLITFVFSSSTGQWQPAVSKGWSDLSCKLMNRLFMMRHYSYGCFYWECTIIKRKELLVFDTKRMEFSITDLPSKGWGGMPGVAIVEAGDGKLGMFGIHGEPAGGKPDLCYSIRGNKGKSSSQWQVVNTISIPSGCRHYINAATERYFLLISSGSSLKMPDLEYFSMDVKKLELERVCVKPSGSAFSVARIYTSFPPSLLSSPTI